MGRKLTLEECIRRFILVHEDKYDYSKVVYNGAHTKIIIGCPIHGTFKQTPNDHWYGSGCPKCAQDIVTFKQTSSTKEFISKVELVPEHQGKGYDYSQVVYVNAKTKVIIGCPIHGLFEQTPNNHLRGEGCPKCGDDSTYQKLKSSTKEFISKAELVPEHQGKGYDYSQVVYVNAKTKVIIGCSIHGLFEQTPDNHLHGEGCPKCFKKHSEISIEWLEYEMEKDGIFIQHAENIGEFKIPGTNYAADGYCKETNTIYEFHGDYWHGNPKYYLSEDINPSSKLTYGELYAATIAREEHIRSLGYNLVVMWEDEYV